MHKYLILLITALLLIACTDQSQTPALEYAQVLDVPRPLPEFRVSDQAGADFTRANLLGSWTVIFSGFTYCPDVCPMTLGQLRNAQQPNSHHRTVLVSVDPERDTPEVLKEYLAWFDADWIGLTGSQEELDRLLDSLGMAHVRVPLGTEGDYTLDHATAIVLLDPRAQMVAYWKAPLDVERLAADLAALPAP